MGSGVPGWPGDAYIDRMSTEQFASLAFLGLLGAALAGSYIVSQRGQMGKMAQQAAIWGLIIIGTVAAVGLWSDIQTTVIPRQEVLTDGAVSLPRQADGHYYVTINVNDVPVDFVVDTGASAVVLTREDAARVGLDVSDLNFIGTASTANGVVRTAPVMLDRMDLSGIVTRGVPAVVNEGEMFGSLLGMSYLGGFDSIAIRDNAMVLSR